MLNSRIVAFPSVYPSEDFHLPRIVVPSVVLVVFVVLYGLPASAQEQSLPASDFAALSTKADQVRDAGRLDDAVVLYQQALTLRPQWAEGWWSLGTIQYDRNAYREAARAFEKVIALDPKAGTARVMLGLCEFERGDDANALRHLEEGRRLGVANDPQLWNVVVYHEGVLFERKGEFESAQETLAPLCRQGVESKDLDRTLGMIALRIPRENAETRKSQESEIIAHLGEAGCLGVRNKFDQAEREYGQVVSQHPNFPNIHYAYGKLLLEARRPALAVEQFKLEIKNNPRQAFAWLEIAAANYRVDSSGGIPYAEEGVKLDPQLPFGHYLLGLLFLDTRQYQAALRQLEIARPAFSSVPNIYVALGTAYSRLGRKQDAARAWATFRRLNQENPPGSSANIYRQEPQDAAHERLGPERDAEPPR